MNVLQAFPARGSDFEVFVIMQGSGVVDLVCSKV